MPHPRNSNYIPGDYWAVCDRTGFEYRISEMKKTWDGLLVHKSQWEPRHPQDFVRSRKDTIAPSGPIRPPKPDRFSTEATYVDTTGDVDYSLPSFNNGIEI